MKNLTFANRIKHLRKTRRLTQQEVACALGLPQCSVSRVETGHDTDAVLSARIEAFLTTGADPGPVSEVPVHLGRQKSLAEEFNLPRVRWEQRLPDVPLEERLNTAQLNFGNDWIARMLERVKSLPGGEEKLAILSSLVLDSSYEYVFVARLLIEGWEFRRATPFSLGLRMNIRDRQTLEAIGDVVRWVLYYPNELCRIALFLQVSVVNSSPYRLDFPGVVKVGDGFAQCLIEVDGPKHDDDHQRERDRLRTLDVNVPTFRFKLEQLKSSQSLTQDVIVFARPLARNRPPTVKYWS